MCGVAGIWRVGCGMQRRVGSRGAYRRYSQEQSQAALW